MKLIDLLVQELPKRGGWPEGSGFIAADEDGAIDSYVYKPELDTVSKSWVDNLGDGYHKYNVVNPTKLWDWDISVVDRSQYEAALAASNQVEWDGEGLPPVGCECEAKMPSAPGEPWKWRHVKVVISGMVKAENECLVYDLETTRPAWVDEFRPGRTEAQLKREETIKKMMDCSAVMVEATAGLIYDAIAAGEITGVKLDDIR